MFLCFATIKKKKKRKLGKNKQTQNEVQERPSSHLFLSGSCFFPPRGRVPSPSLENLGWLSPHHAVEETCWELEAPEAPGASTVTLGTQPPRKEVQTIRLRGRPRGEKGLASRQAGVGESLHEENGAARSTASTQSRE